MKTLQRWGFALRFTALFLTIPVSLLWRTILRPIILPTYKIVIILRERIKTHFHAQHKMLAVLTHRFAIHGVVFILSTSVIILNIGQAREVRAQDFAEGSLIAEIFRPDEEIIITAGTIIPSEISYLDTSTSVKYIPSLSGKITNADIIPVSERGEALVKTNVLANDVNTRDTITKYIVQNGDTASSIAENFGVTTKTILWSNNLTDASLIRPGDTLFILPTSGIAHTVRSGETISSIAKKYNADETEILAFNNMLRAEELTAGDEIIVPGGEQPPPPVAQPATRLASLRDVFFGGNSGTAPTSAPAASGGSYNWPTTCSRISQYFTYRHTGIDIDCDFGDTIFAAQGGTVTSTSWNGGYGLQVMINHGNGVQTRYGHLQKVFVSVGQQVAKGQSLGEMGSTGRSTGSHLHFEIIVGGGFTNPFNYY